MKYKEHIKLAFLGGDKRATTAAIKLAEGRYDVFAWAMPRSEENGKVVFCDNISEAITNAEAIVLPLPSSSDGVHLNCIFDEEKIKLVDIADVISSNAVIVGGRLPRAFFNYCEAKGIKIFDYFESEGFQIKNAYTTAEAALGIAMNNLSKNIRGAKFGITGYGRIAKQLVRLLRAMGGEVTVAARKESDRALAELEGCDTVKINEKSGIRKLRGGYDVIFNTVPETVFDADFLEKADKNTLFIELASAPGGIDISAAKALRTKVLWAPSLPGKYAPESAGELIADCVRDMLESEVIP